MMNEAMMDKEQAECVDVLYEPAGAYEHIVDHLISDANSKLPEGTVYEIRCKQFPTEKKIWDDWAIAWYYFQTIAQEPLFRLPVHDSKFDPEIGCNIVARCRAGERKL